MEQLISVLLGLAILAAVMKATYGSFESFIAHEFYTEKSFEKWLLQQEEKDQE